MYSYLYLEGGFFSFCFFNIRVNWFANWKVSMVEGLHTRPPHPHPHPQPRPIDLSRLSNEQNTFYPTFALHASFLSHQLCVPVAHAQLCVQQLSHQLRHCESKLIYEAVFWFCFLFFHCRVPAQIWATRGGHCAHPPHRASMHWRAPWGLLLDAKISVPKKKIDRQEDNDNLFYSILRQIISQFYRVITPMTMSSSEFSVNYRLPEWRQFKWQREGACHLGGGKGQVRTMPSCSRRRPSHTAF